MRMIFWLTYRVFSARLACIYSDADLLAPTYPRVVRNGQYAWREGRGRELWCRATVDRLGHAQSLKQ